MSDPILGTYQLVTIGISEKGAKCKVLKFKSLGDSHLPRGIRFTPFDEDCNFEVCVRDIKMVDELEPGDCFEIVLRKIKVE